MSLAKPSGHNLTVWARDMRRTAWAWSCSCGTRFVEDLPTQDAAQNEARAHARTAPPTAIHGGADRRRTA